MNGRAQDLARCADEPIRVPGAIQPQGRLLVLGRERHELVAYSANWASRSLAEEAAALCMRQAPQVVEGESPTALGAMEIGGQMAHASLHAAAGKLFVEVEAHATDAETLAPIYTLARRFPAAMQRTDTVRDLSVAAVEEMKRLTGFGRCLLYRFDNAGHGEVLAEALDVGYDSYQDHHFPAEDIPAQARQLYLQNHIRLIPDANYVPVDLVCVQPGLRPRDIDLSLAALRSVSPIHLEYMRNMGTLASMSVSIVVRGQLWGLISCHHRSPRELSFGQRAACEHLGRLVSLQIEAREDHAEVATRLELRRITLDIVRQLADSDASLQKLVAEPAPLLRLVQATGVAVVLNDSCWSAGEVPATNRIHSIAAWAAAQGSAVVFSDTLWREVPALEEDPAAAGVLGLSISQVHRHVVLWFRPERVRTVRWAGDPVKQPRSTDGRIHPRRSFNSWLELIRGRADAWTPAQLSAAAELRQALIGVVLRRAEELAEVATELGRVNKELEAFSYTVSHDLRAPMRHIAGYVDLVLDAEGPRMEERTRRYLAHVKQAAAYAGHLVDALLDFSRMGRAALKRTSVDTETLVDELVEDFKRQHEGRGIEWVVQRPLPTLWADPFLLQVVLRNLLGNACKYTREQPLPRVTIRAVNQPGAAGLEVSDNGAGFQMQYVHKLFGVFQRLHRTEDYEGTGIGLASVRRIVERHGGTVWAQGEPGRGASFGFVLPLRKDAAAAPGSIPNK